MPSNNCIFCDIIESTLPNRIIFENEHAVAINDGFPVSPGHSLIILRRHERSFFRTNKNERDALFNLLDMTKDYIDGLHGPASYNVGINDGPAAGQTVPHLHIHLIPRYYQADSDPRGGVRWVIPGKAKYWEDS